MLSVLELTAIIGAGGALAAAGASLVSLFRIHNIHISINSRMDQLLAATSKAQYSAGAAEGEAAERARRAASNAVKT